MGADVHRKRPKGRQGSFVATSHLRVAILATLAILSGGFVGTSRSQASTAPPLERVIDEWPAASLFNNPSGVAVAGNGDIFVADTNNDRVQVFDNAGNFLRQWGSSGTADGEFNGPFDLSVDSSGNVYVVDTGNDRIGKFDSVGNSLLSWAIVGDGDPTSIAEDAAGDAIYVGVKGGPGSRIEQFDDTGAFVQQFDGSGILRDPEGIAVGPSGNVFVIDAATEDLEEFSSDGTLVNGVSSSAFADPQAVAVDAAGDVFVLTGFNDQIAAFDSSLMPLRSFGAAGVRDIDASFPRGLALDQAGDFYVADTGSNRIDVLDVAGNVLRTFGSQGGRSITPNAVATDASGDLFIADAAGRVEEFAPDGTFLDTFGSTGSGDGELHSPAGIAIDGTGNVFVADTGNDRIEEFDSTGTFERQVGTTGSGDGEFRSPQGVAVDASGTHVFVIDGGNSRVQEFDQNLAFVRQWGSFGSLDGGEFNAPFGIATDAAGDEVFVADTSNHQIQEFDASGAFVRRWGSNGTDDGQFDLPQSLAVDGAGNAVFVADTGNDRIQEFNEDGTFIRAWGQAGSGDSDFDSPLGAAIDPSGNVFVADTSNKRVQEFGPVDTGTHTLAVTNPVTNGSVASSDGGIECGSTCTHDYVDGTTVLLTPTAGTGAHFVDWSGCDSVDGTTHVCTVTLTADTTVTPSFALDTHTLTVTKPDHGSISSDDGNIDCGATCTHDYDYGSTVQLTPNPDTGYHYVRWTNCDSVDVNTNICTETMTADKTATVELAIDVYNLTITTPTHGTVTSADSGIDCPSTCGHNYDYGTIVDLTANPATGYHFTGWTDCDSVDPNTDVCSETINANRIVAASFAIDTHGLTVTNPVSHGSVTSSDHNIDCGSTCSHTYDYGTSVDLTPQPDTGYHFTGWTGCDSVNADVCTVSVTSDETVTPSFAIDTHSLTVTNPVSHGSVTSSDNNIDCGSTCSHTYDYGTSVDLTPQPDTGYHFTGWTGCDSVNGDVCTVSVTADKTVTATFSLTPVYQPDAIISLTGSRTSVGDGVYFPTAQVSKTRQRRGGSVSFDLTFRNDGNTPDRFVIQGCDTLPKPVKHHYVRYFDGTTDVSRAVKHGTYETAQLSPGQTATITMHMRAQSKTSKGRRCDVSATSATSRSIKDVVTALIRLIR